MRKWITLGIVLLVLWIVGWLFFKAVGAIIHLLLLVGVALIVWGLIKRGAHAVRRRV